MTTWTPATAQAETWTNEPNTPFGTFSKTAFSLKASHGKKVFSIRSAQGHWTIATQQAETWVTE